jgi:two-component system chemotaxis sensor kinase CheA
MNSFVEKFKVEVGEYCERLESGLLQLEHDPGNSQVINDIFRMMHTMKGSGGMFGFDLLSEVTHDLESLFEIFRSDGQTIDSEVINFTLKSVDGLKNLMVENPDDDHRMLAASLKAEAQYQIARFVPITQDSETEESTSSEKGSEPNSITFYISFEPDEDIFDNGTNPLYLIDELNALGECNIQVSIDRLPALSDIDPQKCYISWYLFIATTESVDTLNDVFIFVSRNAKVRIEKVANKNVIHQESVLAAFLNAQINGESWLLDETDRQESGTGEIIPREEVEESTVLLKILPETYKNSAFDQTTVDSIRVDSVKIDHYMNLVSELITAQSRLDQVSLGLKSQELTQVTETFEKLNRQLRDNAFDMSLIPIQSLVVRFKRLIHDLSLLLDKEVVFITEGMETELDKNIIEKLIEPLLHIIRNSLDHGIESKAERLAKNKNAVGVIKLKASTVGSYVKIEIEDDGAGLNIARIWEKAISKGLISGEEKMTDDEIYQLIFEPGFSTSELVTDVSGRGVGMDVVKRSVIAMRGTIELASEKDTFARFTIRLPLSLSIIDGLLVVVGSNHYVIPSSAVHKLHMARSSELKKEFRQVIELDDIQLPYLNLREEFGCDGAVAEEQFVVVVSYGNHWFGLVVDEVIREYQAVIKPLGRIMKNQNVFSGASILGTGQLALVIDTNTLIQKYS